MGHPKTVELIIQHEATTPWQIADAILDEVNVENGRVVPGEYEAIAAEVKERGGFDYATTTLSTHYATAKWANQVPDHGLVIRSKPMRWSRSAMTANWTQEQLAQHITNGGKHKDIKRPTPPPDPNDTLVKVTAQFTGLLHQWLNGEFELNGPAGIALSAVPAIGDLVRDKLQDPFVADTDIADLISELETMLRSNS